MLNSAPILERKIKSLDAAGRFARVGTVRRVVGMAIESQGPFAAVGEICQIHMPDGTFRPVEVVGFSQTCLYLMPLGELSGVSPGLRVTVDTRSMTIPVSRAMLGRVVDGLCQPMDGKGPFQADVQQPLNAPPPDALSRPRVKDPLPLGIRVVDSMITCGRGQRVGIFGGSGVGKSTLLGMIARYAQSDVNVIALIGERGREVREFIERDLGPEGMRRSIVVVVTSDQPPLMRIKGALAACALAEYFRDQGKNVLMMMDSVTRVCMAQREIGLAIGEPPTTRGYTPSVFSMLPKLLERSGTAARGSITGLYTVLVEGDDMNEPVADAARSILDGHIVLSRTLAGENHFPAIDVLNSASRVFTEVVTPTQRANAASVRQSMANYARIRDLLDVGAYVAGNNPEADRAIVQWPKIQKFLRQAPEEAMGYEETVKRLQQLGGVQ